MTSRSKIRKHMRPIFSHGDSVIEGGCPECQLHSAEIAPPSPECTFLEPCRFGKAGRRNDSTGTPKKRVVSRLCAAILHILVILEPSQFFASFSVLLAMRPHLISGRSDVGPIIPSSSGIDFLPSLASVLLFVTGHVFLVAQSPFVLEALYFVGVFALPAFYKALHLFSEFRARIVGRKSLLCARRAPLDAEGRSALLARLRAKAGYNLSSYDLNLRYRLGCGQARSLFPQCAGRLEF